MKVQKTKILFTLILYTLVCSFTVFHKYYVSLTEVRIDTEKKTFNVSCKMFTDDLENALFKWKGKKVDLVKSTDNKEVKGLLFDYIKQHFKVYTDTKEAKYSFIGFEREDDAIWCYLEMSKFKKAKKITVINSLLFDYLPEQINVVQLFIDKDTKSEKLVNPNVKAVFEL